MLSLHSQGGQNDVLVGDCEIPAKLGIKAGKEMATIVEIQAMQQYRRIDRICAVHARSVDSPEHLGSKGKPADA